MGKEYGNESIVKLTEIEKVRKKPAVVFGTNSRGGTIHSIFEIISNSIDEARAGYGKNIWVTVHKDNSWTVKDEGRGVPMAYNKKEKIENYHLIFETLYAGGKYNGEDGTYQYSLGTNGLGATATNFASSWFKVESRRDGKIYTVGFTKGVETEKYKEVIDKDKKQKTGTTISWLPDLEVFTEIDITKEEVIDTLKSQAIVNQGITIHFKDERENFSEDYCYPEGVLGYAKELIGDKKNQITEPIIINCEGKGRDRASDKDYKVKGEIVMIFNSAINRAEYYHNSSFLKNGGSPENAKEKALLEFFSTELKKNNLIKKDKLEFEDIGDSLLFISNTFSTHTSYQGQTKYAIDNKFIEDFLTQEIIKGLKKWAKENPLEMEVVSKQIVANQESRLAAGEAKQLKKQQLTKEIKLTDKIDKLTECRSKDNNVNEVYFVEGDSAAGTIKNARNSEFQAVYAMKGKIKNVLKMKLSEILSFPILTNIIKLIGTGIDLGDGKKNSKLGEFDINNRRFSKYIIAVDQDCDGESHIVSLMLTMFFRLMPDLIREGRVYQLLTPLYVNKTPDGEVNTYNDIEQAEVVKKYGKKIKEIERYKGLGSYNATQFKKFLNPETRHLLRFTIDDAKKAMEELDKWMGKDPEPRKQFLEKYGDKFIDKIELG